MPEIFGDLSATDPKSVLINLGLVLVLGQILVWHYLRFSPVLSNKRKFARVLVFIAATTMMVITIVKTSFALSLGLVGALSIIRFRTPIKEPEELAYLFLAIGLGLGLGANQRLTTSMIFVVLLIYLAAQSWNRATALPPRMLMHVSGTLQNVETGGAETALREILAAVTDGTTRVDLRRVDAEGPKFNATVVLDLSGSDEVGALVSRIQEALPGGSVSFVEGSGLD
ncbi:MAG: DUF4956 domain-containing protein [Planctomycetes bacterium]|nr:DUF4956 domain-containing protein [Planctomycetota bacterium]